MASVNPFASADKIVSDLQDLKAAVVIASVADWQSPELQAYAAEQNILGISLDESLSTVHVASPSHHKQGAGEIDVSMEAKHAFRSRIQISNQSKFLYSK